MPQQVVDIHAESKNATSLEAATVRAERGVSKLTWPNRISLFRIFMLPAFIIAVLQIRTYPEARYVAVVVFAIMGLSDALDGYLARTRNERTRLGRVLDPIADKLLLMTACVLLSCKFWPEPRIPNWIVVVVISRDVFILVGALVVILLTGTFRGEPNMYGKATTFFQMTMVLAVLVNNFLPPYLLQGLWWIAAVLTIISGINYMYIGIKELRRLEST